MRPSQAVKDDWYFQMYYDNLPVWGFVGKVEKIIPKQVRHALGWRVGHPGAAARQQRQQLHMPPASA